MSKNRLQMIAAAIALVASVVAQVYDFDLSAALVPAGAVFAFLSGYNTLNPELRDDREDEG